MNVTTETQWQTVIALGTEGDQHYSNWLGDEEAAKRLQEHYAERGFECQLRSRTRITITSNWEDAE